MPRRKLAPGGAPACVRAGIAVRGLRGAAAGCLWLAVCATPVAAWAQAAPAGWDAALKLSQAVIARPLAEGADALPLRDTLGRNFRLADHRGKPLVVNFVYTGCFQACPIATQGLARAVRAAREALGADSFQVVTIGFNQPFDTPEAMAAFARQARIDDARWTFASPRAADVPLLARAFGFSYQPSPKGFDHITQATLVDARGVVYRQVYGDAVELPQFIGPLKELLSGEQAAQGPSVEGLWRSVKLYCTVYDPRSGGYRLNYSLFFELAIGASVLIAVGWTMVREWRRR